VSTKVEQLQQVWHRYDNDNEHRPTSARQAVEWAVSEGLLELPEIDPYDVLAGDMAQALRSEIKTDSKGRRYRVKTDVDCLQRYERGEAACNPGGLGLYRGRSRAAANGSVAASCERVSQAKSQARSGLSLLFLPTGLRSKSRNIGPLFGSERFSPCPSALCAA